MNIIKRHKSLAIVGGLTLILMIVMLAIFAKMIFSNGDSEYGQRLNGITKVSKTITNEIINETKELDEVESIKIRTQGKIIYTKIIFKEGTSIEKAKAIANDTVEKYGDEVLKDYDLGYFLKENAKDNEETDVIETGFITAGTKHPDNDKITWTKS